MKETYFELNDLTHRYLDGTTALSNITLSIEKGKKIAVLGNNGAGKSTLFQHLNGILKPTSGSIKFNGERIKYNRAFLTKLRQQVGIVFQNPDSQIFAGTVIQDLSFGPMNLGWSIEKVRKQVKWAMDQTELTNVQDRPIHFLSIGQKKRVTIAGVMAMDPDVLILDEPTAGLDAYYTKQVMIILGKIYHPTKTIILSTHDVQLAYEWADEIIVMNNGTIIYQGDPISFLDHDDLLTQAHLEKPWVFEIAHELTKRNLIDPSVPFPKNKHDLFQLFPER